MQLWNYLQSPAKTQPRRTTASPILPPSSSNSLSSVPSLAATSSSSASATPTATSHHPLAQPPISASTGPSPSLPLLSLAPPKVTSLRGALSRRRSSYPPAHTPGGNSNITPWVMCGTPTTNGYDLNLDQYSGFGSEVNGGNGGGTGWTPGTGAWEALLNFDTEAKLSPSKGPSSNLATAEPLGSSPTGSTSTLAKGQSPASAPTPYASISALQPPSFTPARIVQLGADLAWKTALASVVEVEGVGQVALSRILQEIWKRGGGDVITAQCLWPSIIIALAMPPDSGPGARIPTPSAQSAMSLQQLYNLSIRHWEPAIFSGLLSLYTSSSSSPPPTTEDMFASQHFGPSTPMKEQDLSQWMNLTPGAWSSQVNPIDATFNIAKPQSDGSSAFPFPFNGQLEASSAHRRMSLAKPDVDESYIRGIDEILAGMEDGKEEHEREMVSATLAAQASEAIQEEQKQPPTRQNSMIQFPTPETDSSNSPPVRQSGGKAFSPVSMASPFVSSGSTSGIIPSSGSSTSTTSAPGSSSKPHNKPRPTQQLSMPPVDFIPPPPMCMFFNPSFENLTDGKAGIWRGDLEVRGRGGGKFPIIVVGEKGTENLWQSHLWSDTLTYPLKPTTSNESYTSTMIPVSHLAREGLIPITMGMVLCNAPPEGIAPYVNMVHGLHAEGVGFHLPCETRLPIVFLPAKFHSNDPLLRLGIAFMGKAGVPYPSAPLSIGAALGSTNGRGRASTDESDGQKKKRRRLSAPASAGSAKASRKKEASGVGKIEEEA
ncbi:hypothetical protein CI109_101654 [Kwoniella shandongensis]|uniref:Uncharacterized protein n=1 Tax=Kwoniella shandongensis TaxID=1734106 RepID=A0A5M6C5K9_9TREE|nr:uncharacterized protein CI109_001221 [Kwoniella shandongensis]KAA5530418.1 hypothetical protein CI109_001221 [Kwoniella shandongensis]